MRRSTAAPQATRTPAPNVPRSAVPRAAQARRAEPEIAQYEGNIATDLAPIAESPGVAGKVVASHLGSNAPEVVATAVNPGDAEGSPVVRRFMVEKEKNISHNGIRSILREGKEIDENNYDIASLVRQGVKLKEITEQLEG